MLRILEASIQNTVAGATKHQG